MDNLKEKLAAFAQLVQAESISRSSKDGLTHTANAEYHKIGIYPGSKFTRISIGGGMRYCVRNEDGAIFAAKGTKGPNFNQFFGTLDTINQFYWGGYTGRPKEDSEYVAVPVRGGSGYHTCVKKET